MSRPASRVAVVFGEPCEVAPAPAPDDRPFTLPEAASLVVDVLEEGFRLGEAGCDDEWSNFFLRSFTLGGTPPAAPCPFPAVADGFPAPLPECADRLSTGFDAERWLGRRALRWVAVTGGCLGVVPFPFDRNDGGCRLLPVTAEAIGSFTGDEAFPVLPVCCTLR